MEKNLYLSKDAFHFNFSWHFVHCDADKKKVIERSKGVIIYDQKTKKKSQEAHATRIPTGEIAFLILELFVLWNGNPNICKCMQLKQSSLLDGQAPGSNRAREQALASWMETWTSPSQKWFLTISKASWFSMGDECHCFLPNESHVFCIRVLAQGCKDEITRWPSLWARLLSSALLCGGTRILEMV